MQPLSLAFSRRFIVLTLAILLTFVFVALIGGGAAPRFDGLIAVGAVLFGALSVLGLNDLRQTRHAVLRNYPIAAHLRFLLEEIRPEMRQYFFESETDGLPFSRTERAIVCQRAKMQLQTRPFGTQRETGGRGYEWLRHSIAPRPVATADFRIMVGRPDCARPYSASVFNISAMSFGALSALQAASAGRGARCNRKSHLRPKGLRQRRTRVRPR